jgi:hypothetical protein
MTTTTSKDNNNSRKSSNTNKYDECTNRGGLADAGDIGNNGRRATLWHCCPARHDLLNSFQDLYNNVGIVGEMVLTSTA